MNPILLWLSILAFSLTTNAQQLTVAQAENTLNGLIVSYQESPSTWFTQIDKLRNMDFTIISDNQLLSHSGLNLFQTDIMTLQNATVTSDKIILSSYVNKAVTPANHIVDTWLSVYMETRDLSVYKGWVSDALAKPLFTKNQSNPFEFKLIKPLTTVINYKYYYIVCKVNNTAANGSITAVTPLTYSIELFYCLNASGKPVVTANNATY